MGLGFLVPFFLAGLAALAVPVIIHLTRRQNREPVPFPSLMFLQRLPEPTTRRRHVRNWPLLLLRCAALALLAAAFARPFLSRGDTELLASETGRRDVVVLLDRSYSMEYAGHWDRALAAARDVLDQLGPQDRASLVLFDTGSEAATQPTDDRGLLQAALADARPGPRGTRYVPALRHAERLLAASAYPRRGVVVISDFQRGGWEAEAGEMASVRLPHGTTVTPISVGDSTTANVMLASANFRRATEGGRERATVSARLAAQGEGAPRSVPVTLEVDGRPVAERSATLEANGSATVEFDALTLPTSRAARGVLRIPADALPTDDRFHFTLAPDPRLKVLVVNRGSGSSFYLTRALAIGNSPGFAAETRRAGSLSAGDLAGKSVVIFDQAPLPGGEFGRRLREFVEGGGGLVVTLGEGSLGGWGDAVPGAGALVDRSDAGGTTVGHLDVGHPVFEPFSSPHSGDFSTARIFRYRPMDAAKLDAVLARFADGGVALGERRLGKGRVLIWTSTLDNRWNDLPLQPVFLPFVHQLVGYASGHTAARPWFTVGEPVDPAGVAAGTRPSLALAPSGQRVALREAAPLTVEEPGFWTLRNPDSDSRGVPVAVNVDRMESDLTRFDPQELISAVATSRAPQSPEAAAAVSREERERQQSAWWYLLAGVLLLLVAETFLANRRPRAAAY